MPFIGLRPLTLHRPVFRGSAAIKEAAPSASSIQTREFALLLRISQQDMRTMVKETGTTRPSFKVFCSKGIYQSRTMMPYYGSVISTTESVSPTSLPGNLLFKGITRNSTIMTRYIKFPALLYLLTSIHS